MDQPIWKLAEEINYQAGAVVSRQLVKSEHGNITLFAFDKGEGLSEHTTPYDALVQVLDGTAEISIDGVAHEVPSGSSLLMPANHPHALKATSAFKMLLTMIK